jgi:8-oxo-dGTP pyrophosphatase MutT (NUDIX family)
VSTRLNKVGIPILDAARARVSEVAMPLRTVTKTAKAAIFRVVNGRLEILLVHEREHVGGPTKPVFSDKGKPAGWGMPGGGVEFYLESEERIREEMDKRSLNFEIAPDLDEDRLAATREVLEETGLFIVPGRLLIRKSEIDERYPDYLHFIQVYYVRKFEGELTKESDETDDADWFPVADLPQGMYRKDRARILASVQALIKEGEIEHGVFDQDR